MLPFSPCTVMPAPMVVVPLPSRSRRLPAPVAPNTTVPLPPKVPSPSKLKIPLLLMLTVPFKVRPPVLTRSRALARVRSKTPSITPPSRKLAAFEVACSTPPLAEVTELPVMRAPL